MTSKFYLNVVLTAIAFELLVLVFTFRKMNVSKEDDLVKNFEISQAKYETPREMYGSQEQVIDVRIVGVGGDGSLPVKINASSNSISVFNGINFTTGNIVPIKVQVVQK